MVLRFHSAQLRTCGRTYASRPHSSAWLLNEATPSALRAHMRHVLERLRARVQTFKIARAGRPAGWQSAVHSSGCSRPSVWRWPRRSPELNAKLASGWSPWELCVQAGTLQRQKRAKQARAWHCLSRVLTSIRQQASPRRCHRVRSLGLAADFAAARALRVCVDQLQAFKKCVTERASQPAAQPQAFKKCAR